MLRNQTYLGKVKYQPYKRNADRTRSYYAPIEWFDGQHDAVISQELFDRCIEIRNSRAGHHQATPKFNHYLLRGLVYCYRCCNEGTEEQLLFPAYGKMRAQAQIKGIQYYRCRAKDFHRDCQQGGIQVEIIDDQVIAFLKALKPPKDWRGRITATMGAILGEISLQERLDEIREAIERMDFRWDNGFITDKHNYLEKRIQLQNDLEKLTPIPQDDLEKAADMLENFSSHWEALAGDPQGQHELIKLIVQRVYIEDDRVVAITLKADYHEVLGENTTEPAEADSVVYTSGSDGDRARARIPIILISPHSTIPQVGLPFPNLRSKVFGFTGRQIKRNAQFQLIYE